MPRAPRPDSAARALGPVRGGRAPRAQLLFFSLPQPNPYARSQPYAQPARTCQLLHPLRYARSTGLGSLGRGGPTPWAFGRCAVCAPGRSAGLRAALIAVVAGPENPAAGPAVLDTMQSQQQQPPLLRVRLGAAAGAAGPAPDPLPLLSSLKRTSAAAASAASPGPSMPPPLRLRFLGPAVTAACPAQGLAPPVGTHNYQM